MPSGQKMLRRRHHRESGRRRQWAKGTHRGTRLPGGGCAHGGSPAREQKASPSRQTRMQTRAAQGRPPPVLPSLLRRQRRPPPGWCERPGGSVARRALHRDGCASPEGAASERNSFLSSPEDMAVGFVRENHRSVASLTGLNPRATWVGALPGKRLRSLSVYRTAPSQPRQARAERAATAVQDYVQHWREPCLAVVFLLAMNSCEEHSGS